MTDEMEMAKSREIELVRRLNPRTFEPSPDLVERSLRELQALIAQERPKTPHRPEVTRRLRLAVAALATAACIAAGWNLLTDPGPADLSCPDGSLRRKGADPAAQCAALWQQERGTPPPPLTAYDNGRGVVEVVPAHRPPPAGWRPLEPAPPTPPPREATDELDEALADHVSGLSSRCLETEEARALVDRHLRRLGLADWLIESDDGASGKKFCVVHHVDVGNRRVMLRSVAVKRGMMATTTPIRLAGRLRGYFLEQDPPPCESRTEAAASVRREAAAIGLMESESTFAIRTVADAEATCARVVLLVDQRIEVVVRGPAP